MRGRRPTEARGGHAEARGGGEARAAAGGTQRRPIQAGPVRVKTDGEERREETDGGHTNPTRSDTMLGIYKLHYQGAKGHIYSTCTERKYAENPLTDGENTIYNIHLTDRTTNYTLFIGNLNTPCICHFPLKACAAMCKLRHLDYLLH
jgi:hypothetical protein